MKSTDKYSYKILNWILFLFIIFGVEIYNELIFYILKKLGIVINDLAITSLVSIPIYFSFMIIIYFIFKKSFNENIKRYGADLKKYFFWALKVYFLGLLIMFVSNILIYLFYNSNSTNEVIVQDYLQKYPLYMTFSAVIYSPFMEEVAFRKIPKNVIKNKYIYIFISGILFGFAHCLAGLNNAYELFYIIPYGVMGASFAYMYYKTNNIFIPITFHLLHNLVMLIISLV